MIFPAAISKFELEKIRNVLKSSLLVGYTNLMGFIVSTSYKLSWASTNKG